jgi:hypothetical protein
VRELVLWIKRARPVTVSKDVEEKEAEDKDAEEKATGIDKAESCHSEDILSNQL